MQSLLDKGGSIFRKKVLLFGRSISLSMIAALATVTLAAAVWGITAFTLNVNVTSGSQDSVSEQNNSCIVFFDNNTSPDATTCLFLSGIGVNISNASPGDQYNTITNYSAPITNSNTLYAQPIDVSAWGATLELMIDYGCGAALAPGASNVGLVVQFQFDADGQDTSPSTSYGPFPIVRQFATTIPTCP
jgi:hypothetical protein